MENPLKIVPLNSDEPNWIILVLDRVYRKIDELSQKFSTVEAKLQNHEENSKIRHEQHEELKERVEKLEDSNIEDLKESKADKKEYIKLLISALIGGGISILIEKLVN